MQNIETFLAIIENVQNLTHFYKKKVKKCKKN